MVLKKGLVTEWVENNPPVRKWLERLAEASNVGSAYCAYDIFVASGV